jgi:hypothetical protein
LRDRFVDGLLNTRLLQLPHREASAALHVWIGAATGLTTV